MSKSYSTSLDADDVYRCRNVYVCILYMDMYMYLNVGMKYVMLIKIFEIFTYIYH